MRAENFTDDTRAWLVFARAMTTHTAQPQIDADFEAWQHEQRFDVRRKAEARRRGVAHKPEGGSASPFGHTSPTRQDAMPVLFVVVVAAGVTLLALATVGAYDVIRSVFRG